MKKKPPVAEPLLPKAWQVPTEFRDRLGDEAGKQRIMRADDHLLVVLHAPPQPGQNLRLGKTFWRDPAGAWKPVALTHTDHPIGELLDAYEAAIDAAELQDDRATTAKEYFEILTALGPLVRASHNVHAVLQDARKAAPQDRQLILLRDRAYGLNRRAELLQQDAKNTLDFVIARQAEEQAQAAARQANAAHRLNVLAALFFPVLTAASVLGMNLRHGLEGLDGANGPLPMLIVLSGGLLLGLILAAFVTKK